jgi:catechol 2,3-dioxygenase-like lactoylglutathione lyase family enzyme
MPPEKPHRKCSWPKRIHPRSSVESQVGIAQLRAQSQTRSMINGAHAIIYSKDAEKVRDFFRDVLGWKSVDAGRGWLIFGLPPTEVAVHPTDGGGEGGTHELFLMCDDLDKTMADLKSKDVEFGPVREAPYGLVTAIKLPGGGELGLYQPRHPTALSL